MTKLSASDLEHLSECYNAFGLGESISNGHLTDVQYDSAELNEATSKIDEGVLTVRRIYEEAITKGASK